MLMRLVLSNQRRGKNKIMTLRQSPKQDNVQILLSSGLPIISQDIYSQINDLIAPIVEECKHLTLEKLFFDHRADPSRH